jgi:DNA topoisomerase VI subunit B
VVASLVAALVIKELTDNGLDACDPAGRPGQVEIGIDAAGNVTIADRGTGIPNVTPEQIAGTFCVARPMRTSKLLRGPTRGAISNGLRVCLGYVTATQARLIVETGNLRVELEPDIHGTSRIIDASTTEEPWQGLSLTVIPGDRPFTADDLVWAENAITLAQPRKGADPIQKGWKAEA